MVVQDHNHRATKVQLQSRDGTGTAHDCEVKVTEEYFLVGRAKVVPLWERFASSLFSICLQFHKASKTRGRFRTTIPIMGITNHKLLPQRLLLLSVQSTQSMLTRAKLNLINECWGMDMAVTVMAMITVLMVQLHMPMITLKRNNLNITIGLNQIKVSKPTRKMGSISVKINTVMTQIMHLIRSMDRKTMGIILQHHTVCARLHVFLSLCSQFTQPHPAPRPRKFE